MQISFIEDFNRIDTSNIQTYSQHGTADSERHIYTCTVCGNSTCISDSFSYAGHRMICGRCKAQYFGTTCKGLFEWLAEA